MSRFANYLRNLLPCTDVTVMEMAAKAVGVLAFSSGTYAAEYVEFEMRKALEWLATDKTSDRRHAAVRATCVFVWRHAGRFIAICHGLTLYVSSEV